MSDESLELDLVLNISQAEKQLADLAKKGIKANVTTTGAGSNSSGGQQSQLDKDAQAAKKLADQIALTQQKMQLLTQAQAEFAAKGEQGSAAYAKVTSELAGLVKAERGRTQDQEQFNSLVQKEIELRKQANETLGGKGTQFSPHSQRQQQQLEELKTGQSQKTGILERASAGQSSIGNLLGSAKSGNVAGVGEAAAGLGKIGAAGAAAGLALASFGLISKTAGAALAEAGQKFKDNAQKISDMGGPLDQQREATRRVTEQQNQLANSKLVASFENAKTVLEERFIGGLVKVAELLGPVADALAATIGKLEKGDTGGFLGDLAGGIGKSLLGLTPLGPVVDRTEKIGKGLGRGDAANAAGGALADIAAKAAATNKKNQYGLVGDTKIEYDNLKRSQATQEAQMAMERQDFERSIFEKRRDYILEAQQTEIEHQNNLTALANRRHDVEQQYSIAKAKFDEDFEGQQAEKKFALAQSVQAREFALKMQYAEQDHQQELAFSQQKFDLQLGFDKQQQALKMGRKAEDTKDRLVDMSLGGASGLDYLKFARDTRKDVTRAEQDFALAQFQKQAERGLDVSQSNQKFAVGQGRDVTTFLNQQKDAQAQRSLEIEAHLNERKWQSIELEIQHANALRDINFELSKEAQQYGLQKTKLANKASDMDYSTTQDRKRMEMNQANQRIDMKNAMGDFAYGVMNGLSKEQQYGIAGRYGDIGSGYNEQLGRRGELSPQEVAKQNADLERWRKAHGYASGGFVPGSGNQDTVLALLTPGEYVVPKDQAAKLPRFAEGGFVGLLSASMQETKRKQDAMQQATKDFANWGDIQAGIDSLAGGTQAAHNSIQSRPGGAGGFIALGGPNQNVGLGHGVGGASGLMPLGNVPAPVPPQVHPMPQPSQMQPLNYNNQNSVSIPINFNGVSDQFTMQLRTMVEKMLQQESVRQQATTMRSMANNFNLANRL